jgi:hypothetical protein
MVKSNESEPVADDEGVIFLQAAFNTDQIRLETDLRSSNRIRHQGDKGEVNEQYFIDFLRRYLPNRYTVDKAMVIDSLGATSDSIDVVVFDRQYTPTLLDSDKHRYVPAESVYAVFECKPTINKTYLNYAAEKAASVRRLHRTSIPIAHAGGCYPAKPPHDIVAGILAIDVEWADGLGTSFKENHAALTGEFLLDCGFAAMGASFDTFNQDRALTFGPANNSLAYFAFRLLSRLQACATVPAVDWSAYASQLSKIITTTENLHV